MNKLQKQIIILLGIVGIIFYLFTAFSRISAKKAETEQIESEITELNKKINQTVKDHDEIGNYPDNFVENAYFDREEYFESYIRDTFRFFKANITNYQSKKTEQKFSEVTIKFTINVIDFFNLVEKLEKGDKFIVIDNVAINRSDPIRLTVYMKIKGFYQ